MVDLDPERIDLYSWPTPADTAYVGVPPHEARSTGASKETASPLLEYWVSTLEYVRWS